MFIDVLVAEIGSTTTLVNAFSGIAEGTPRFIAQGQAATSVLEGDVRVGLRGALADMQARQGWIPSNTARCLPRVPRRAACVCACAASFTT